MLNPSFKLNARDYLKLAGAGVVVVGRSLSAILRNLLGVLFLITLGLLKAIKILK